MNMFKKVLRRIGNHIAKGSRTAESLPHNHDARLDQPQHISMENSTSLQFAEVSLPREHCGSANHPPDHPTVPLPNNSNIIIPSQPADILPRMHHAMLYQPQHVSMQNPTFNEIERNQNIYYSDNNTPLKDLASLGMLDATFDSSVRDPPPRCHPGTREDILRLLQSKLHESNPNAWLTWLRGAAGVGKSAIMQTLAEAEADTILGASLFFSRPNKRNDSRKVFTTIAYQFVVQNPSYRAYLSQRITEDPVFLNKSMDRQFNSLVTIPFAEKRLLGDGNHVILLDGLDECKDEREQCRIVDIIHDFVFNHPSVPLTWIIASRPEEHLKTAFSRVKARLPTYCEQEVPIDSERGVQDVERYLHAEFKMIQDNYPYIIAQNQKWPSEEQFLTIASAASGLFIFASTVIRFIDDPAYGNPVSRLAQTLSILGKKKLGGKSNPLELLDAFYEAIMSEVPEDVLPTTKRLLGYVSIDWTNMIDASSARYLPILDYTTVVIICNVLGFERDVFYGAVRKLHSVLDFPDPREAHTGHIKFVHASFLDYLCDTERSHIYSIDSDDVMTYIWRRSMTILQQWMQDYKNARIELYWVPENAGWYHIWLKKALLEISVSYCIYTLKSRFCYEEQKGRLPVLIPFPELVKHFEALDYSRVEISGRLFEEQLLTTLLRRQNSSGFLQHVSQVVSLKAWDRTRFFESFKKRRWFLNMMSRSHSIFPEDLKDIDCEKNAAELERVLRKETTMSNFLDLLEDPKSHGMKMMILGAAPSKCCAWVEYEEKLSPEQTNVCYVFPYIV